MPSNSFHALRLLRRSLLREVVTSLLFAGLMLQSATAVAPDWWATQGVLNSQKPADDYAVANLGQLKSMASKAAAEMNSSLPGGAGTEINALITGWTAAPGTGVVRDDYAALTIGQLKSVVRLFYDRLAEAGVTPTGTYPWRGRNADDYALANLGQLKMVFSFEMTSGDVNQNGIPDVWELQKFGNLNQSASGDYDHDGLSNLAEYQAGTEPTNPDTDGDGVSDGQEVADGTDPTRPPPSATWTQEQLAAAADAYEIGLQQRVVAVVTDIEFSGGDPEDTTGQTVDKTYRITPDWEVAAIWEAGPLNLAVNGSNSVPDAELANGATLAHDAVADKPLPDWQDTTAAQFDYNGTVVAEASSVNGVSTAKGEFRLVRRLKVGAVAPVDAQGNPIKPEINSIYLQVTTTVTGTNTTSTIEKIVEFTIPEGSSGTDVSTTTSGEMFPPVTTKGTSSITLVPVDIVAAFGFSPTPEMKALVDNNLRQSASCVSSLGGGNDPVCAFLIKGKPYEGKGQQDEKIWAVVTTSRADELKCGLAGVPYVVFNGHSNMGLGPCFETSAIHSTSDFFNIGNPQAAINLSLLKEEGYPQDFTVVDDDVPQQAKDYVVLPDVFSIERFDNSDGVKPGGVFNLKGVAQGAARATGYHFHRGEGAKFLVCDVPEAARAADLPPLGYQVFFYNACSTARDYAEVFQHGTFICSSTQIAAMDRDGNLDHSTQTFIDGIISGESLSVIFSRINEDQLELEVSSAYLKNDY